MKPVTLGTRLSGEGVRIRSLRVVPHTPILMKRAGLDESDAFRRLQKLASDKNLKLVKIAEVIVTAEEAMQ